MIVSHAEAARTELTREMIRNALSCASGDKITARTTTAADMLQAYVYAAYPERKNMISSADLAILLARQGAAVQASWDGYGYPALSNATRYVAEFCRIDL